MRKRDMCVENEAINVGSGLCHFISEYTNQINRSLRKEGRNIDTLKQQTWKVELLPRQQDTIFHFPFNTMLPWE